MTVALLGPTQKRGRSVQDVATPRDFLDAVEAKLGKITWDLAADESNHVAESWLGPGGVHPEALAAEWWNIGGLLWLNPPYGNIAPWAAKCARSGPSRIALLVPASVGSNWFAEHVDGKALVLFLRPRLTFVGHEQPYPKDCMLAVYGVAPGYGCWKWKP